MCHQSSLHFTEAGQSERLGGELSMIKGESGSIIPLGVSVISLSAIFALVIVELIGVQFQTLQNKQVCDVLVLKVALDLKQDSIAPIKGLEYRPVVTEVLESSSSHLGIQPSEVSVISPDGKTMTATVCTQWRSITGITFGSFGNVCASSKARAIS